MTEATQRTFKVLSNGVAVDNAARLKRFEVENLLANLGVDELSDEWQAFFKGNPITLNGEQLLLEEAVSGMEQEASPPLPRYTLSPEITEDMLSLEKRGLSLGAKAIALLLVGVVLSALAVFAYVDAVATIPTAALKTLDVPTELYERFSDVVVKYGSFGNSVAGGLDSVSTALGELVRIMSGPVMFGVALFFMVGTLLYGVVSGEWAAAFRMAAPIFIIGIGLQTVGVLSGSTTSPEGQEQSERVRFANAVADQKTEEIKLMLDGLRGDWAELYVTAQLYLLDGTGSAKSVKQAAESLRAYSDQQLGFTPSGEAVYAIEHAADGIVTAPVAKSYFEDATQKAINGKRRARVLGGIAGALVFVGMGALILAVKIRRRVGRIKALALA